MVNQNKPGVSIDKLPPEQARGNFHLLLLANPNYFGNLKTSEFKPVLTIAGDTAYEELSCVGFSPSLSRLEGVVTIKQNSGYGGDLCQAGSQEYVRFYLSFDNGATWLDQGVVGFTAHDLPGPKPLEYSVTQPISVSEDFCFVENLPQVRAILSWNYEPPANTPGFVPVWGNVVNVTIQIPSFEFILLDGLLAEAKVKLPASLKQAVDLKQAIPAVPKKALSVAEIAAAYKEKPVPPKRFLYPEIEKVSGNQALSITMNAPASAAVKHPLALLGVNLGDIIAEIFTTSGDTTYEELDCVGLDINRNMLAGVVKVKLPYGFNGGLCTAGSTEYVAFWVDWGSGYEYAGTATLNTHDISAFPPGGLEYAVGLPVDVASHRQPCEKGPKTADVRAILSWQTSPPPTNPNYVPVWGNQLDALVQIPAGLPIETGTPDIAIIGGIGVAHIDTSATGMTLPGAVFALQGTPADPWDNTRQCPFGGRIVIQGLPSVGDKYRVWIQKVGSPLPIALTDPIVTTDGMGNPTTRYPDGSGFFSYLDNTQNIDNVLAYWDSSGDDQWNVWLEIASSGKTTQNYLIQLVNTAPVPPEIQIHIDSGGDCKQFSVGKTPLDGHFVATESGSGTSGQIGHYTLTTLPSGNAPSPSNGISDTGPAPGEPWTLSLTGMKPCGYVVLLNVWDNTILNSAPNNWNGNDASVGFCIVS